MPSTGMMAGFGWKGVDVVSPATARNAEECCQPRRVLYAEGSGSAHSGGIHITSNKEIVLMMGWTEKIQENIRGILDLFLDLTGNRLLISLLQIWLNMRKVVNREEE
jgi:hypothetical protein